jgi:20S proteasome alpha/beta subunit
MATELLIRGTPENVRTRKLDRRTTSAKAMTCCVAVACQDQGNPRIVLCSDSRLDFGVLGSTNSAIKLDVLGFNWCAQMAGDWSGVQGLCAILQRRVQEISGGISASSLAQEAQKAVAEFLKSPLYQSDGEYQLLISGFDSGNPAVLEVSIYPPPQNITLKFNSNFGAVGFGYAIATTLLTLRECNSTVPLSYGVYLAYEAKRASEKTGKVGKSTTLLIQAEMPSPKDKAQVIIMNDKGKTHLESLYSTLWKIPVVDVPELSADFFTEVKKQSPG